MAFSFTSLLAQDSEVTNTLPTDITYNVTTTPVESTSLLAGLGVFLFLYIALLLFYVICSIKIFQKAGRKWWEAIIPIYSTYVLLKIVGRPGWWLLLLFIPFVNIIVSLVIAIDLAKVFKKDAVYGVFLLWLLGFIGLPMLAFGSATYAGPEGSSPAETPDSSSPPAPEAPSEEAHVAETPPTVEVETPPADQPQPPQAPPTNLVQ